MSTLGKGDEFADRQMRKYLMFSLLCFGIVLAVIFAEHYIDHKFGGFIVAALAAVLFTASFRRWSNWSVGKPGEQAASKTLDALSDRYALLNDVMLPDSPGNIDYLLIGPNGIFVIETKNYSGRFKCKGDRWFAGRRVINSPSKQVKRNGIAVYANLADLYAGERAKIPYITPILVFVNKTIRLKLIDPTIPVLRPHELVDFVRNYEAGVTIDDEQQHAIARYLQSLQSEPGETSISNRRSPLLAGAR